MSMECIFYEEKEREYCVNVDIVPAGQDKAVRDKR